MEESRVLRLRLRESLTTEEWKRFLVVWRPFSRALKGGGDIGVLRENVRAFLLELEQRYFLYYANTREAYERLSEAAQRPSRTAALRVEEARIEHESATGEYQTVVDFIEYFIATYMAKQERETEPGGEPIPPVDAELCLYPATGASMVRFIPQSDENSVAVADRVAVIKGFMPILARDELPAFPVHRFVPCHEEEEEEEGPVVQYKTIALHRLYRSEDGYQFARLTDHERFCALFELVVALADASKRFAMSYSGGGAEQSWDMHLMYEAAAAGSDERRHEVKSEKTPIHCHSAQRVTICDYRPARLNAKSKKETAYIDQGALAMLRRIMTWFPVANVTQKVLVFLTQARNQQRIKYTDLLSVLGSWYHAREFNFDT